MFATWIFAGALASQPISAGALAGTIDRPGGKTEAVVLILPGSGPTDREGNNPLGVTAAPYKMLAEGLAAKGIATVRIDKRGLFGSKAAIANPNDVSFADYAADTAAWVAAARAATGARCIWLAGHSEGGLVALRSAKQKDVCGLILISSPGRPMAAILREQLSANPANAPLLPDAERILASLEAGKTIDVSGMHPALAKGLFNPAVQPFLIDMMRQDPVAELRGYKGPVLVISGAEDIQVGKADADALGASRAGVSQDRIAGMNHVLKSVPAGDKAANLAAYGDSSKPLAPGLVEAIANFVKRRGK